MCVVYSRETGTQWVSSRGEVSFKYKEVHETHDLLEYHCCTSRIRSSHAERLIIFSGLHGTASANGCQKT